MAMLPPRESWPMGEVNPRSGVNTGAGKGCVGQLGDGGLGHAHLPVESKGRLIGQSGFYQPAHGTVKDGAGRPNRRASQVGVG